MKTIYSLLIGMVLSSCGPSPQMVREANAVVGATGATGAPCSIQDDRGEAVVTCPDGTSHVVHNGDVGLPGAGGPTGEGGATGATGASGQDGETGPTGPTGALGAPGPTGEDAVPVTVIQFCPGYAPTYPSVFPETGLCIQGNLYAVFWMGGQAWLALVTPGIYSSTSTSASCSFTVSANCQIS